jgi:hypothetical protein
MPKTEQARVAINKNYLAMLFLLHTSFTIKIRQMNEGHQKNVQQNEGLQKKYMRTHEDLIQS